ncbi:MAG: hypothetical protein ACRYGG_19575, partial [Janthinobacterium lividum]
MAVKYLFLDVLGPTGNLARVAYKTLAKEHAEQTPAAATADRMRRKVHDMLSFETNNMISAPTFGIMCYLQDYSQHQLLPEVNETFPWCQNSIKRILESESSEQMNELHAKIEEFVEGCPLQDCFHSPIPIALLTKNTIRNLLESMSHARGLGWSTRDFRKEMRDFNYAKPQNEEDATINAFTAHLKKKLSQGRPQIPGYKELHDSGGTISGRGIAQAFSSPDRIGNTSTRCSPEKSKYPKKVPMTDTGKKRKLGSGYENDVTQTYESAYRLRPTTGAQSVQETHNLYEAPRQQSPTPRTKRASDPIRDKWVKQFASESKDLGQKIIGTMQKLLNAWKEKSSQSKGNPTDLQAKLDKVAKDIYSAEDYL